MQKDELFLLLDQRDENTCRNFIDRHKDMVFRICLGFVNNKEDAEELTQDVFIDAISNIKSFKKEAKIETWLYRIAVNRSLNLKRKQKRAGMSELSVLNTAGEKDMEMYSSVAREEDAETKRITRENNQILYGCIEQLKEDQRIAFILNKMEGFSYAEVAEIMNISFSSVESLIHRAKKKLQVQLVKLLKV